MIGAVDAHRAHPTHAARNGHRRTHIATRRPFPGGWRNAQMDAQKHPVNLSERDTPDLPHALSAVRYDFGDSLICGFWRLSVPDW